MRSMLTRGLAALSLAGLLGTTFIAMPTFACGDKTVTPGKPVPAGAGKVTIVVEGMHCGDCANTIRNVVLALGGVYDATIDFDKGQAHVAFDKKATTIDAIAQAITRAGFKAGKATPEA